MLILCKKKINGLLISENNNLLYLDMMKNFIKQIRKERELSTEELAIKVGTSPQQINHLENGKRKLTWVWIQRIAKALECHPMEITDGPISGIIPKNEQEKELLKRFRGFSEGEKSMYLHMLESLEKKKEKRDEEDHPKSHKTKA